MNVAILLMDMNRKLDTLLLLKETVQGIEHTVQMISDQYDDILHRLNEQENDIKDLKKRVDKIERADAANEVRELRSELNELEWRSRRKNIEIHGVLETEGEDLLGVVKGVASKLGVEELKTEEVSAVHRLPSKPGKTRGIIVSFARQETRDAWLSKKRVLNRSSGSGRLYITENMTKQGRTLLWQAREWAKVSNYKFVWYKNGKVFVRQGERMPAHVISSEDDLRALGR